MEIEHEKSSDSLEIKLKRSNIEKGDDSSVVGVAHPTFLVTFVCSTNTCDTSNVVSSTAST